MLEINLETVTKVLTDFIKDSIYKNNFKKGIIGLSGGIDSAVVLALAQRALGSSNIHALLMPYRLSSKESVIDAEMLCHQFGIKYDIIDISAPIDTYFSRYPTSNKLLVGNKCARERMSVLYDYSIRKKALVIGTSNKSELLIGYSTIFGDSAAAFLPLGDLYKSQVFKLAVHLSIPESIIDKKPSADLWEDQNDEEEIGLSYKILDEILFLIIDLRFRDEEILNAGYSKKNLTTIKKMIVNSQYKRTMPPVAKLNNRTIGMDFRYLRDWNK